MCGGYIMSRLIFRSKGDGRDFVLIYCRSSISGGREWDRFQLYYISGQYGLLRRGE